MQALLERDGYAILPDVLDGAELQAVRDALAPHFAEGYRGRNPFEGHDTQRVYCLVAKSRAFDRLILDPDVLDVAGKVLGPNFLLTATLAIKLEPGESAQDFHTDDVFYGVPRPRPPFALSTLWAIDEFTHDNGATLIRPGSHRWGDRAGRDDASNVVTATMTPGSVLLYYGTLVHAGGANNSSADRLGISIQYCTAWARQQENFMMAIGVEGARELPPRLQELIGYSIHPPFMGMIDGRHPRKLLAPQGETHG
ncbi:MAG TPA: phytanoyl-CoA dioxygenase family protein [Acidimicrobiales bacterium]|nr:phytanoyl-CoA dioxygenase family protein [Acidimicrobiales bacterium]